MKPAKGSPTVIYPALWKSKPIMSNTADRTAVHNQFGTASDGLGGYGGYAYLWNNIRTHYGEHLINVGDRGFNYWEYYTYGKKHSPVKPPRIIRIMLGYGYYFWEHYPLIVDGTYVGDFGEHTNRYDPFMESWYLNSDVGTGNVENYINYYKFYETLLPYCLINKISLYQTYPSQFGSGYGGPELQEDGLHRSQGIQCTPGGSYLKFDPPNHPGRWLFNTIARYPTPFVDWNNPPIGESLVPLIFDNPKDIVGGEVLNIVFATDAYSAYHNNTHINAETAFFYNPIQKTIANTGCYESDLQEVIDAYPNYRKWGTILVNSPKNPEFFPKWYKGDYGKISNAGTCYCLEDAQLHFNSAAASLAAYNVKALIRQTVEGPNPALSGNIEDSAFINEERHMEFSRGPITYEEIAAEVYNFWDTIPYTGE